MNCERCSAKLLYVPCNECYGLGLIVDDKTITCEECEGDGGWYECPMAAGGKCGNKKVDVKDV